MRGPSAWAFATKYKINARLQLKNIELKASTIEGVEGAVVDAGIQAVLGAADGDAITGCNSCSRGCSSSCAGNCSRRSILAPVVGTVGAVAGVVEGAALGAAAS